HESPHRLATTLVWVEEVLGPRRVAVAREISKLHEEWLLGEAAELGAMLAQTVVRGECTVVVEAPARGTGNG
ncbi:MAG: 16S rRNA (cytidine(1402)-2'-O)-methyltransferase, partial [Candidatus Dormibacteria bacterium]